MCREISLTWEIPDKAKYDAYIAGLEQQETSFSVAEFHVVDVSGGHEVSIVPSEQYFVKAYGDSKYWTD
jgi:hypothetical protein